MDELLGGPGLHAIVAHTGPSLTFRGVYDVGGYVNMLRRSVELSDENTEQGVWFSVVAVKDPSVDPTTLPKVLG